MLAFVVSFVWFTLLYFVASLLKKDSHHESFKNGSFGRANGDVDNHLKEEGWQEGKHEAKGKAVKHAAELLAGDSTTAEAGARKLEIKEVHVDGFSKVSQNTTRIASSDASLNCKVRTDKDRVVEKLSIFDTGTEEMHADSYLERLSEMREVHDVPVDGFVVEHNIGVVSTSTSGDSLPSVYSISSAQIHDLLDMSEVIEMSSDFLVGRNQNIVVPSNTSEEYGEELFEDRKELSDSTPYGIIDFIDKHETRDQALDGSFAKDEIVGLLTSSDGSDHGRIPSQDFKKSTEEEDAESVPELLIDSVPNLERFEEQRVLDVPITEANTNQSVPASNEVHDICNDHETLVLPLYFVETIKNRIAEASISASTACDFIENQQTATRALGDSVNSNSSGVVASRESSEDEADKVNENSTPEGAPRGRPLLRRSPSQWWKLCGVVDVFAGAED